MRLKFWKKNDDFGIGDDLPPDPSLDLKDNLGLENQSDPLSQSGIGDLDNPASIRKKAMFDQSLNQAVPQAHAGVPLQTQPSSMDSLPLSNKDIELISSKLDTIKAELDSMNQRIQKIEKLAEHSSKNEKKQTVW